MGNVFFRKGLSVNLPKARDENTFYYTTDTHAFYLGDNLIGDGVSNEMIENMSIAFEDDGEGNVIINATAGEKSSSIDLSGYVTKTGHSNSTVLGRHGVEDEIKDLPFTPDSKGSTIAFRDENGGLGVGDVDESSEDRAVNVNSFAYLFGYNLRSDRFKQTITNWICPNPNEWQTIAYANNEEFTYTHDGFTFEGSAKINKQQSGNKIRYEIEVDVTKPIENIPSTAITFLASTVAYKWQLSFPVLEVIQNPQTGYWNDLEGTGGVVNEIRAATYMEIAEYSWKWIPAVGVTDYTNMLNGNGLVSATPAYLRTQDENGNISTQFFVHGLAVELDKARTGALSIDGLHFKVYIYA